MGLIKKIEWSEKFYKAAVILNIILIFINIILIIIQLI